MASSDSVQSLTLGDNINFKVDPNIPQSPQQSLEQINAARDAQVALNAATTGGRPRKRQKSRRRYRGGDGETITVAPLPLGTTGENAQANNVAMTSLFANAVSSSKYDNEVSKVGGKRRHRSRRLSKKQTYRKRTNIRRPRRRSSRYRKSKKSTRSRRSRR